MKWAFLMLWLLLVSPIAGYAHYDFTARPIFMFENNVQTVDTRIDFSQTLWQPDNQSFEFRLNTFARIYRYDIPSNTLDMHDVDLCAYKFSEEQNERFKDSGCAQSLSPDGRYVLFKTGEVKCGEGCVSKLAIGDLETGVHSNLQLWSSEGYTLVWSENSRAFLISDYGIGQAVGGLGTIWYVSVPNTLTSTTEIPGILLSNFALGEQGYVDISPDGLQVLVRGGVNSQLGLSLWNMRMPTSNQQFTAWSDGRWLFKDQMAGGATFLPSDPQHILVVTDEGILKYDLETETSTVINTQIKGAAPNWVYFSSDVQYALAYTVPDDGTPNQKITLFQLN